MRFLTSVKSILCYNAPTDYNVCTLTRNKVSELIRTYTLSIIFVGVMKATLNIFMTITKMQYSRSPVDGYINKETLPTGMLSV